MIVKKFHGLPGTLAILTFLTCLSSASYSEDKDEVQLLINELYRGDRESKEAAAVRLGTLGDERAVQPLLSIFRQNAHRRSYVDLAIVVDALAKVDRGATVEALIEDLQLHNKGINSAFDWRRRNAAEYLGVLRDERAAPYLVSALNDRSFSVREEAAKALVNIDLDAAADTLLGVLTKAAHPARGEAASVLADIGDSRAVEPLIAMLAEGQRKLIAIWSLGKLRDARALDPLIEVVRSSTSTNLQTAALDSLKQINDTRSIDVLVDNLRNPKSAVRSHAAIALEAFDWVPTGPQKIDFLLARWQWEALEGMGSVIVQPLVNALATYERNESFRLNVVKTLGKVPDMLAFDILVQTLTDPDATVRQAAIMSLIAIDQESATVSLINCLETSGHVGRSESATALGNLKEPRAFVPLVSALGASNNDLRQAAATALGMLGDRSAIEALLPLLTDWYVSRSALRSLHALGWEAASEADVTHASLAFRRSQDLVSNWGITQSVLTNDIRSEDYRTIENALYGFIGLGREEILPLLVRILDTEGDKVMAEAYLNCGNRILVEAAKRWASSHGYQIRPGSGAAPVAWGRL